MQFSNFSRAQAGNQITFKNTNPIQNVKQLKYYTDNSSGTFTSKQFRWSFDLNYWSSWETLNQGRFNAINMQGNSNLYLEIRYTLSNPTSGTVTLFTAYYDAGKQPYVTPPNSNPACETGSSGSGIIDADKLCGKSCDYYLWRTNHKGTQPIDTVDGLQQILYNITNGLQNTITDGANIDASGAEIFDRKEDRILYFKRIKSISSEILVEDNQNGVITIAFDASLAGKDPSVNELYQITEDLQIQIDDLSTYVDQKFFEVDSSIDQIFDILNNLDVDVSLYGQNVGTGTGKIFRNNDGSTFYFRSILGVGSIDVSTVGDTVILSLDASSAGGPTWLDPDPISADVGGLQGGDTINVGDNSIEILEDILYEYFPPDVSIGLSPNPAGYYEIDQLPTAFDPDIFVEFNNDSFSKLRIFNVQINKTQGGGTGSLISQPFADVSAGDVSVYDNTGVGNWEDTYYTAQISNKDADGTPYPLYEVSAGYQFVYPYYYGIVTDDKNVNNITASDITSLNKLIVPKQSNEVVFDNSANIFKIKFVYAYDESYGNLSTIFDVKNDFNVTTSFDTTTLTLPGNVLPNKDYKVYIKSHWIDVSSFKLIFNI